MISAAKKRVGVELYLSRDGLKTGIKQLVADKDAIESEVGEVLDWRELPTKRASRVIVYRNGVDPSDEAQFAELHAWLLDHVQRFRKVFGPRVRTLDLEPSDTENSEGDD